MPNITPSNYINIEEELGNLTLYKYHPNAILNVSLNRLSDILDGKVQIVDPANPFIYLLETSCLNTAFAIQEYTLLTRKLYPRLANNENDLYLHMSDYDYLGRFSEPAYGIVDFNILLNDFENKAVYDPIQNERIFKIPRHFKVKVDKYIFTLTSAIIIRKTDNNVIDIKFENQTFNNIFPVETNYINFDIYKVNHEETYINFQLKLPEIDIETLELPIEKSKLFKEIINFNPKRQFYYFRAFYFIDNTWKEMLVTHTNEVYDINTPTCIIKVNNTEKSIEYFIPPVYINTNRLGNKVKFLVYTTNGYINANFRDFKISDFSSEYNPIFPDIELDNYTTPLQLISKIIYLRDEIVGGKDSITFEELKYNVINNSIGDRALPITNKQLEFLSSQNNFKLIKDIDVITNRLFLLETIIPSSTTRYPITRINLDIIEYKTTINNLRSYGNNITSIGNYITIIPEDTVFKLTIDGLQILDNTEYTHLTSISDINLITVVNNNTYISTFYHYILDTSGNETKLRAYDVNNPIVKKINFKEFNPTARVGINTTNTNIGKIPTGYMLDILCNLKKYVDLINETTVKPYLVYVDENGAKFYLESNLYTTINNNPVYRFILNSNFYIDNNNRINITNFKDANGNQANIYIELTSALKVIFISNYIPPNYVPSNLDNYIYGSYLTIGKSVVTLEEITVEFGKYLKYLYSPVHLATTVRKYQTYTEDVPLRYNTNVYNSINEIIHYVNDIVYDGNNNIVYKHRAGDIVLDENNNPIPIGDLDIDRFFSLLFIDYKAYLANKDEIVKYKKYIRNYLTENITNNAEVIQNQLLENTVAYVTVPKNISNIRVKTGDLIHNISSMQSFNVEVYVNDSVYNDISIRDNISYTITKELDDYLNNNIVIKRTEILDILYNKLKEFIKSISISKFTELNKEYIEILDKNGKIGLRKILINDPDGYNLKEDITISFNLVN